MFQFHLVRLKASKPTNQISLTMFQFHLVRLKENGITGLLQKENSFNSI